MNLFKIGFRNVKKNLRDYSIYFLTLMLSISLFYAFNSIESQYAFKLLSKTKGLMAEQMGNYISIFSVLIAIILAFLIVYANQFLLKRRKRELGIYMTLGMEQKKISRIFIYEIFIVGVLALVVGIVLGIFISQGLSLLSLKLFVLKIEEFKFLFSLSALLKTVLCFVIIFFIVMLFNTMTISNVSLIELLNANRKHQELTIANNKIYWLLLLISIITISFTWINFSKYGILPNAKGFNISLISIIIGTALLFLSVSALFMNTIKSNNKIYYRGLNTFLFRQIGSKIYNNFISMTVIAGLLTMTITVLSTGGSIANTMNEMSNTATPYDMTVIATVEKIGDIELYNSVVDKGVALDKYLENYIEIPEYNSKIKYSELFLGESPKLWKLDENLPEMEIPIVSVSDMNKVLKMQNKELLKLEENEFIINCNYDGTREIIQKFLDSGENLLINNNELIKASDDYIEETIMMSSIGNNDRGTLIVSDDIALNLDKEYIILNGIYSDNTNPDEVLERLIPIAANLESGYRYTTKTMMLDMFFGTYAFMVFISCYIGFILLLISVVVLALQQLTEATDNAVRYRLLSKLGTDKKLMDKTLFKQIGIYFLMPLLVAIVFSIMAMKEVSKIIYEFLNMPLETTLILTVILFIIIYGGYFIITYLSCKKIISEK